MYGLLITFETNASVDDLVAPFTDYAHALNRVPGLLNKTWLHDGPALGGFHLFESKEAADAYLASDLARGLMDTDGFDNFETRGFDVLAGLSALTGVPELAPLSAG